MARPGYVKARNDLYEVQARIMNCETALSNVESITIGGEKLIPELVEVHRRDYLRSLDAARKDLELAEAAFAVFNQEAPKAERVYYDTRIQVCLSLTNSMFNAMQVRTAADHISTTELIRRALQAYLVEEGAGTGG